MREMGVMLCFGLWMVPCGAIGISINRNHNTYVMEKCRPSLGEGMNSPSDVCRLSSAAMHILAGMRPPNSR
jgi:hypothetical protein